MDNKNTKVSIEDKVKNLSKEEQIYLKGLIEGALLHKLNQQEKSEDVGKLKW